MASWSATIAEKLPVDSDLATALEKHDVALINALFDGLESWIWSVGYEDDDTPGDVLASVHKGLRELRRAIPEAMKHRKEDLEDRWNSR